MLGWSTLNVQRIAVHCGSAFVLSELESVNFIGRNYNGLWLGDLYTDCHLSPGYEALADALLRHTTACLHHPPVARPDKRYIGVERLYMPLAADGANVDMLFGMNVHTALS